MDYESLINNLKDQKINHENASYSTSADIIPPYTEEELSAFESHFGERLPEDFRNYMLNVSKEVFVDYYPVLVDDFLPLYNGNLITKLFEREIGNANTILTCQLCRGDFSKPCKMKEFAIPEDLTSWWTCGLWYSKTKRKCPKCQNEYSGHCKNCNIGLYGGHIRVGNGGCSNEDILIIKGPHKGTVWKLEDSGGDKYKSTFGEYVY